MSFWLGCAQELRPGFTKATVSAWRVTLEERGLGSSSIFVRMSAIRKLAVEATDISGLTFTVTQAGASFTPNRSGEYAGVLGLERPSRRGGGWCGQCLYGGQFQQRDQGVEPRLRNDLTIRSCPEFM